MTKNEMVELIMSEYGYSMEELQDEEGKLFTNSKLQLIIEKEESLKKNVISENKEVENMEINKNVQNLNPIEQIKESIIGTNEVYEQIKDEDMILVMNGCSGELIHRSKRTGRMWKFTRFGQIDKMPFIELVTINNINPSCFEQGKLIILDDKVANNFNLSKLYKNIITPNNIDELFKRNITELEDTLKALPEAMKKTFVDRARELYSNRKIDSVKLIKFIENFFGISLEDNSPISDIV